MKHKLILFFVSLLVMSFIVPVIAETDDKAADPAEAKKKSSEKQLKKERFWVQEGSELQAFVKIDAANPIGPVNRLIFGAGLMWPPTKMVDGKKVQYNFEQGAIDASKSFLSTGSVRLWGHWNKGWTDWWLDFCDRVKPARRYIFVNIGHRPAKKGKGSWDKGDIVFYNSEEDNNLYSNQTPKSFASFVKNINKRSYPGHPNGLDVKYWELWNEPTFPSNGGWKPVDHAKFCLDAAKRMREVDPTIKIGPHMYNPAEWNEKFLTYLAENGLDKIDFIVSHYYDTKWFQPWNAKLYGSYLGRVAYSSEMRRLVRRDIEMVNRIGKGKWKLVSTEWNNHPERYDWPGEATHDLPVALFQAATLQAFTEEGMDAAMVFALRSDQFGLFGDPAAEQKWPTYYVFDLYGKYFNGYRLEDYTVSPTFAWDWKARSGKTGAPREVPYIDVMASKDGDKIVLMVVNKHPDTAITLNVDIEGMGGLAKSINMVTLTGKDKNAQDAIVVNSKVKISSPLAVEIPEHSFSAIIIDYTLEGNKFPR